MSIKDVTFSLFIQTDADVQFDLIHNETSRLVLEDLFSMFILIKKAAFSRKRDGVPWFSLSLCRSSLICVSASCIYIINIITRATSNLNPISH